jgi:hypothetical protein
MQTEADRLADAIRENLPALDEVISTVRGLHRRGKPAPKASARYLAIVRRVYEFSTEAQAVGGKGPLFDNKHQPIAFRDQLVGFTAEQMQALRWKGVADCLRTAPAVEPVRFLEAAE